MRTFAAIALLVISQGSIACDRSHSTPSAPSTLPPSAPQPVPVVDGLDVAGTVADTAFRSLSGARIDVLDGPQAGMSTTADRSGNFAFRGVFDDTTRFRATEPGYVTATATMGPMCAACNPHRWIHFYLEVLAPPVDLAGDYTLTFTTDDSCSNLPDEARARSYTASIARSPNASGPANAYFTVALSGATFVESRNWFEMGVAGDYVGFWLEPVIERLGSDTYLLLNGTAAATVAAPVVSTIAARFDGTIEYCVVPKENGEIQDCYGGRAISRSLCTNSRLTLTRR